jgi:hypothetical protein
MYPEAALALENYWKKNPEYIIIPEFRQQYIEDPTEDKFLSSTFMWGIHYVYSYQSVYSHLKHEDRINIVETNILFFLEEQTGKVINPVIGFFRDNAEKLKPIIDAFNLLQKDSPLRALDAMDRYIDLRNNMLYNVDSKTTLADLKEKDNLMLKITELVATRNKMYNEIHPEHKSTIKGGIELSLLAKNKIKIGNLNLNPYTENEPRVYKTFKQELKNE